MAFFCLMVGVDCDVRKNQYQVLKFSLLGAIADKNWVSTVKDLAAPSSNQKRWKWVYPWRTKSEWSD